MRVIYLLCAVCLVYLKSFIGSGYRGRVGINGFRPVSRRTSITTVTSCHRYMFVRVLYDCVFALAIILIYTC